MDFVRIQSFRFTGLNYKLATLLVAQMIMIFNILQSVIFGAPAVGANMAKVASTPMSCSYRKVVLNFLHNLLPVALCCAV